MKTTIALAAALAVFALPSVASAANKHRHHYRPAGSHVRAQAQIACTQYGCIPVPRGCYSRGGRTYSGMPSGFDVVVCGNSSLYGNY
jgi:hypothetical protein